VIAVAVTPTFAQMAFGKALAIEFPMLSDWEGTTAEAYGVRYDIWKGHRGLAKRSLFVLKADATIIYSWSTDDALQLPDMDALMSALSSV